MNRKRLGRILARWSTELLVVFVGVYAAFALAQWKENRDRSTRAALVRQALIEEIREVQAHTHRVALFTPSYLAQMDSSLTAGTPIAPEPWLEPVNFQPHVWNAAVASGVLDLFDVESFLEVSEFYNLLNAGFEQIDQLRGLSETQLLPRLGEPASTWYEPGDAPGSLRFRPEVRWYPASMARLGELARCITVQGDSALDQLGARPDSTYAGLSAGGC